MKVAMLTLLVFALMNIVSACSSNDLSSSNSQLASFSQSESDTSSYVDDMAEQKASLKDDKNMSTMKGQIVFQTFEGGFYSFISDSGGKFTLQGLPKEYTKNGIYLEVTGSIAYDVMTTTQFGQVFKVQSFTVLDETKVTPIKR